MARDEKFIITDVSALNEVFKLFEDERDADGQLVLSEFGLRLMELTEAAIEERVNSRTETLIVEHVQKIDQAIDIYMEQELEESVDELRKLMILAVSELGGATARDAFLAKIAALARANILSAASGAWAQGSPNDSTRNKDSLRPNSRPAHYEDMEEGEIALKIFNEAASDLDAVETDRFKTLCEGVVFSGDEAKLRTNLTTIREAYFVGSAKTAPYVAAISRTARKG
jgi:hypothetical protein